MSRNYYPSRGGMYYIKYLERNNKLIVSKLLSLTWRDVWRFKGSQSTKFCLEITIPHVEGCIKYIAKLDEAKDMGLEITIPHVEGCMQLCILIKVGMNVSKLLSLTWRDVYVTLTYDLSSLQDVSKLLSLTWRDVYITGYIIIVNHFCLEITIPHVEGCINHELDSRKRKYVSKLLSLTWRDVLL